MPATKPLQSFPDNSEPDFALADIFFDNAIGHLQRAKRTADRDQQNAALHAIAIAIELLLKSHLLRTATDDDWNRINIGHDLDKAATYVTIAGLELPPHLQRVIAALHPHFMRGGFQRDPTRSWPTGLAKDACEVVRELARSINEQKVR